MAAPIDDLSRTEYPSLLDYLTPGQALAALQDRIRCISKNNQDIADWIQERRKIEDQYVAGLKRLTTFKGPAHSTELGVFQPVWDSIIRSVDSAANSHHALSDGLLKDVETPLRSFQGKKEFGSMTTISSNLQALVRDLEDSQDKSEKLARKAGKSNAQKLTAAHQKFEAATQQFDSQAPFIFETLQALDEQRTNHLRDVLTQFETFEVDQANQLQATAATLLNQILEVQTADEIQNYVQSLTQSRPRLERRSNARHTGAIGSFIGNVKSHTNNAGSTSVPDQAPPAPAHERTASTEQPHAVAANTASSSQAPAAPPSRDGSNMSDHSTSRQDIPSPQPHQESNLRSVLGTVFGRRRRQSLTAGFGQLSPYKNSTPAFGRLTSSSHGRTVSPRASSNNLAETHNRLASLVETPDSPNPHTNGAEDSQQGPSSRPGSSAGQGAGGAPAAGPTADDLFGVAPPPGPPPSQRQQQTSGAEAPKDAEGFTVRPAANDPISLAQREAAASSRDQIGEETEAAFKVSIQEEPVVDEDPQDKQAALNNALSTLSLGMPTRKTGTMRGRREVRNTIYVPAGVSAHELPALSMPPLAAASTSSMSRGSTFASSPTPTKAHASFPPPPESSFAGSDTRSIRSTTSLGAILHVKHHESSDPGLSASIIERVSASFEGGELKTVKIAGEAAFSYVGDDAPKTTVIKLNNYHLLEAIGPNPDLLQTTPTPDEFILQTGHLHHKPASAFSFRLHSDNEESHKMHCLFQIRPDWKPMGDKLGLFIHVRLNPVALVQEPVVLRNVAFIAKYEGAIASSVSAKPTCTHLKDKHVVFWRIPEITLTAEWHKIVVMRVIGDKGAEPKPGRVDSKWDYLVPAGASMTSNGNDLSISYKTEAQPAEEEEEDPFADAPSTPKLTNGSAATWSSVPTVWQIASGQYGTDN